MKDNVSLRISETDINCGIIKKKKIKFRTPETLYF